jgi:hypothetical protein
MGSTTDRDDSIGVYDAALETNLDLSPDESIAVLHTREVLAIAASLLSYNPQILDVAKSVAVACGLPFQKHKAIRAKKFLLGLYERIERIRSEYVRREEFLDLMEDCMRRTVTQPEQLRREEVMAIMGNAIQEPSSHVLHKMFVRLADEMPTEAVRILAALHGPRTVEEQAVGAWPVTLSARSGFPLEQLHPWLAYLDNQSLVIQGGAIDTIDMAEKLTPIGKLFERYRREAGP